MNDLEAINFHFRSFLLGFLTLPFLLSGELPQVEVEAEAAILINADTGVILYEKNPHVQLFPASTTKIGTAAFVFNNYLEKIDEVAVAEQDSIGWVTEEKKQKSSYSLPAYWLVPGGTHMGILKGEELSLRDLLHGLLIVSANDAANVIAQHLGGTIPEFVEKLNHYARQIGCLNTTFCNPHGLHHPDHKTTAYDMALLAKECFKNSHFRKMVNVVKHVRPKTNKQAASTLVQNHPLLKPGKHYYPKAIGAKTGYTSLALNNLVVAADDGERTLIAVLMKTKERDQLFTDAIKLLEAAFGEKKVERLLLKKGVQKFSLDLEWAAQPLQAYLEDDVSVEYFQAEAPKFQCVAEWLKLLPPIKKGQVVGQICLQDSQNQLKKNIPILAYEDVSESWSYWFGKRFLSTTAAKFLTFLFGALFLGGIAFLFRGRSSA